jgi:predicted nuclease of predicted toxin-antitoxin system
MKGFFFDENLPSRIQFIPSLPLVSTSELGSSPTDTQVWEFARRRELVIVSKDSDFSERIILRTPPPWVVHLRFGNLRRSEFHARLARAWPQVETLLKTHKLVNVYPDRVEGVH